MAKLEVKAVEFTDVREKKQLYIVIGENENKLVINVGQKTFDKAKELTNGGNGKVIDPKKRGE